MDPEPASKPPGGGAPTAPVTSEPGWIRTLRGWRSRPPTSWRSALLRASAVVYLPQLMAFPASPLAECDHCIAQFWQLYALVPGLVPAFLVGGSELQFLRWPIAITVSVLVLVVTSLGLRRGGRTVIWTVATVGIASALNACLVATALRM